MFFRIILGIAVIVLGFLMVWKTVMFQEFLGRNNWAEQKFGPGGTTTFYKLMGVGVAFLGMLIATNLISNTMESLVGLFVR